MYATNLDRLRSSTEMRLVRSKIIKKLQEMGDPHDIGVSEITL